VRVVEGGEDKGKSKSKSKSKRSIREQDERLWKINNIRTYNIGELYKTQPDQLTKKWLYNVINSILENGFDTKNPVIVYIDNGEALIVDWHHRFEAAKQLKYKRIPIKYIHKNQIRNYWRTLEELRMMAFK